jgi:hypothetical protein
MDHGSIYDLEGIGKRQNVSFREICGAELVFEICAQAFWLIAQADTTGNFKTCTHLYFLISLTVRQS